MTLTSLCYSPRGVNNEMYSLEGKRDMRQKGSLINNVANDENNEFEGLPKNGDDSFQILPMLGQGGISKE